MKAKEIQDLIDFIAKSGLNEVNIETEEFKIKVRKNAEAKIIEHAPTPAAPIAVGSGINRHSIDSHFFAGTNNSQSYFTSVCN